MKIVYNKIIPFGKKFYAINLFGVLFAKGPCDIQTINHEKIHSAQIKELLFIFFYLVYVIEWIAKALIHKGYFKGYKNISFEREAYENDSNLQYLKCRKPYSFLKYIRSGRGGEGCNGEKD